MLQNFEIKHKLRSFYFFWFNFTSNQMRLNSANSLGQKISFWHYTTLNSCLFYLFLQITLKISPCVGTRTRWPPPSTPSRWTSVSWWPWWGSSPSPGYTPSSQDTPVRAGFLSKKIFLNIPTATAEKIQLLKTSWQ